jgi:hypothetical protein
MIAWPRSILGALAHGLCGASHVERSEALEALNQPSRYRPTDRLKQEPERVPHGTIIAGDSFPTTQTVAVEDPGASHFTHSQ